MLRGWACCASGDITEGILRIERGIGEYRGSGSMIGLSFWLTLKAEALHVANRPSEALEAIHEAEALVKKSAQHNMDVELYRLRGVFLAAMGADATEVEASFCEAIRIARSRSRFHLRNGRKRATRNTAIEKGIASPCSGSLSTAEFQTAEQFLGHVILPGERCLGVPQTH